MTCTRVSAKASTPPCASGRIDRCALRAPRSSSRRRCGGALYAKEHDVGASRHVRRRRPPREEAADLPVALGERARAPPHAARRELRDGRPVEPVRGPAPLFC